MSLYTKIIRPLLFCLPVERVHDAALWLLGVVGRGPLGQWILKKLFAHRHPSLEREVFGVKFPNPIGIAAGLDTNATLYRHWGALGYGFVEIGTLTPRPQAGAPKPRMFLLPHQKAMVGRTENPNCGLEKAIEHLRRRAYGQKVVVGANIAPGSITSPDKFTNDYLRLFRNLYQYVDYFTINVASVVSDAERYSQVDKAKVEEVLDALFDFRRGQNQYRPILLKISPDWSYEQIDDMVDILIDTPLDGLVVSDGSSRLGGSVSERKLARMSGGTISGAPLLERTVELVDYVCRKMEYRYPVIGVGGVMRAEDVRRLLDAGASLVQCYSAVVYEGPGFAGRVCRKLAAEQQ